MNFLVDMSVELSQEFLRRYVRLYDADIPKVFANSGDPDETQRSVDGVKMCKLKIRCGSSYHYYVLYVTYLALYCSTMRNYYSK